MHRVEKIGPPMADMNFRRETVSLQGDGEPVRPASPRTGAHEDRCCLTPQLQLKRRSWPERWISPGQGHHHAGRPTGELGGLVEIGRRVGNSTERWGEPLLESQRVTLVLVVVRVAPELP